MIINTGRNKIFTVTHPNLYEFLPTNVERLKQTQIMASGLMLIYNTHATFRTILCWYVSLKRGLFVQRPLAWFILYESSPGRSVLGKVVTLLCIHAFLQISLYYIFASTFGAASVSAFRQLRKYSLSWKCVIIHSRHMNCPRELTDLRRLICKASSFLTCFRYCVHAVQVVQEPYSNVVHQIWNRNGHMFSQNFVHH